MPNSQANVAYGLENEEYLSQNSPNPFSSSTVINYDLPASNNEEATMIITNMIGKVLDIIVLDAHNNEVEVRLDNHPAGVYNYTLMIGNRTLGTKQFVLN